MTDDKVGRTLAREAAARRKRSERERKRRGIKAITVEIRDLECWVDYLKGAGWLDAGGGEPSKRQIGKATSDFIEVWSRKLRILLTQAQLEPSVGLAKRKRAEVFWHRPEVEPAAAPDEVEDVGPPQESGLDRADLRYGFGPEMSL